METKLAVLKGIQRDNSVIISSVPYLIGRCRTADFIIAHVNVSRNHCQIVKESELWKINDFSSSGTFVNGALVGKGNSVILSNGDSIRFGPVESNLCWTFCSFNNDPSHTSVDVGVKVQQQMLKDLKSEKCSLKKNYCSDKITYLHDKSGDNNSNEEQQIASRNVQLKLTPSIKENKSLEVEQRCDTKNGKDLDKTQDIKIFPAKDEDNKEKTESEKIQELTKELQQVQSALNVLEEKNNALQGKLAAGAKKETPSNLVENLTDLLEAEFQCTICSELFVTAVTLSCTHTFCKYCIDQWKKKQKTCPICRKKIINETRSLVVDNYIDKMIENFSLELKSRRETIIKERSETKPLKKKSRLKN